MIFFLSFLCFYSSVSKLYVCVYVCDAPWNVKYTDTRPVDIDEPVFENVMINY